MNRNGKIDGARKPLSLLFGVLALAGVSACGGGDGGGTGAASPAAGQPSRSDLERERLERQRNIDATKANQDRNRAANPEG